MRHIARCITAGAEQEFQRLLAVACDHHVVAEVVLLQGAQGECLVVGIVFDQQDDIVTPHAAPSFASPTAVPPCKWAPTVFVRSRPCRLGARRVTIAGNTAKSRARVHLSKARRRPRRDYARLTAS